MRVLIVGNGGREHALAWKVSQSPTVSQVWVAPGNAGTALEPKVTNITIDVQAIPELKDFALSHHIDLCIVGPEAALAAGIVDEFTLAGIPCFGPTKAAAQLESSKIFSKDFMRDHQIPTAAYASFTDLQKAQAYLLTQNYPVVIKADGLAQGKGVVIASSPAQAGDAIESMLKEQRFGQAGSSIVIEEFLEGEELSFIAMVDGEHIIPLASSQDHKRRDEHDQGPNTGGMGAYSPSPLLDATLEEKIMQQVMQPTLAGLAKQGIRYTGFLYAGLMINKKAEPLVLEFNCRLGDPETQPLLMRLKTDLVELCLAALSARLHEIPLKWDPRPALGVVLCAEGYPGDYKKGLAITGLEEAAKLSSLKVFHAGTTLKEGQVLTNGGRVLCVTALGDNILNAQELAYAGAALIHWPGSFCRKDIGYRAIDRLKNLVASDQVF